MAKGKLKKVDVGGSDEPDLTPMIDVIFLLIIFFLIAGKMIQAGRPEINVPIAETQSMQMMRIHVLSLQLIAKGNSFTWMSELAV